MTLDPYNRDSRIGGTPMYSKVVTHCHARTIAGLTVLIRKHFKGTKIVLVPSGTKGLLRLQDPYGRQIPNYRVRHTRKPSTFWFQEYRWVHKED